MRQQARNFNRTVWQGALIGAIAGGAIGVLAGGDTKGAVEGALIGSAVGAIAGAYAPRCRSAMPTRRTSSTIADVQIANRETEALIADVRKVIVEDRRLAEVQGRISRSQATQAELMQERGRAATNHRVVEQALQGGRDRYRVFSSAEGKYRQQNPGAKIAGFTKALDTYQARPKIPWIHLQRA